MRFSIILPVYNVERFLPGCIDSLLNQQNMAIGQDYELIFVNDGSTDRSLDVLKDLGAKVNCAEGYLIVSQANSGVSAARNEGLKHAKGDYIWFVDSDDMIAPQSLVWADDELKKNSQLKVIRYYNRRVSESLSYRELLQSTFPPPKLQQTATAISLIVNRKHLMDNCISFNPKMAYGEDTLWVFEVNFLAGDEAVSDGGKVNYFYRIRQGSAMQTHNAQARERHLCSMETMLGAYVQILREKKERLTEKQQKHLQKRIDWSVQNVLFDALTGATCEEQVLIYRRVAKLQQSLNWGKISPRYGIKNLIVNLVGLPLKYQPYYRIMGWIFAIIKK